MGFYAGIFEGISYGEIRDFRRVGHNLMGRKGEKCRALMREFLSNDVRTVSDAGS